MAEAVTPVRRNKTSVISLIAGIYPWCMWFSWEWMAQLSGNGALNTDSIFFDFLPQLLILSPAISILIAVIIGIKSLRQIKASGEKGKYIAIAGIILATLAMLAYIPVLVITFPWYF